MAKLVRTLLILVSCGLATGVGAQNLDISASDRAATFEQAGKPTRGMSQATVEANYGAPQTVRDAIGDPPITRWEYPGFVVFFEYDKVIHAVSR